MAEQPQVPQFRQTETVLRNIVVPVLAPVPAFELGVVCEAFGLDRTPPGLPGYDFAVLPGHDLSRLAGADLIIVSGAQSRLLSRAHVG
jgi:hypothetical protein